jgi:hypothetical protein
MSLINLITSNIFLFILCIPFSIAGAFVAIGVCFILIVLIFEILLFLGEIISDLYYYLTSKKREHLRTSKVLDLFLKKVIKNKTDPKDFN